MDQSTLSQIDDTFSRLSVSEQLWLIEHLVHQVQQNSVRETDDQDHQLALMAADPDIQRELKDIEKEFASAESDGLEDV